MGFGGFFLDRGEFDLVRDRGETAWWRLAECRAELCDGWLRLYYQDRNIATLRARAWPRNWQAALFARQVNRWAQRARDRQYDG